MRKLRNFVDGLVSYTKGRGSPELYRVFAAIFIIGAIIERKCWLTTNRGKLYPNQYIVLIGPAGVGKSLCTELTYQLAADVRSSENQLHIAPTSVTKASLIDHLNEAERRIVRPMATPPVTSFNSLITIVNEFGVFMPSWEGEFMNTLTDIWDNKRYAETRRTRNLRIEIPNPNLNLFSATTPAQLNSLLPEGAWDFGFMSRVLLIYSGETKWNSLFAELDTDGALYKDLAHDLEDIYKMYGEFTITDETKDAIDLWASKGGPPTPNHPKLVSYCSRRVTHLLKLCMIASAASDSDRVITLDHFSEALDWLVQAETYMPDIFKSMKTGGDANAINDTWHFAYEYFMKKDEGVPEHLIVAFLQERVPVHSVEKILEVMDRAQLLEKKFGKHGGHVYVPKAPAQS